MADTMVRFNKDSEPAIRPLGPTGTKPLGSSSDTTAALLLLPIVGDPDDLWCRLFRATMRLPDDLRHIVRTRDVQREQARVVVEVTNPFTAGMAPRVLDWVKDGIDQTNTARRELDRDTDVAFPAVQTWWRQNVSPG